MTHGERELRGGFGGRARSAGADGALGGVRADASRRSRRGPPQPAAASGRRGRRRRPPRRRCARGHGRRGCARRRATRGRGAPRSSATSGAPPACSAAGPDVHGRARPPLPPPTPEQIAAYEAHAARRPTPTQRGARRLQGHDHDDRHAPLRGEEEGDPRRPRSRDRHREGRAQEGPRDGHQAARRLRREVQRRERAARGDARRDVPPRRALRGARARRRRPERRPRGRASSPRSRLYKRVIREFPEATASSPASTTSSATRSTTRAASTRRSRCGARSSATTTTRTRSPPTPRIPDVDTISPMPQDHDEAYWKAWRNKYPTPRPRSRRGPKADTDVRRPVSGRLRHGRAAERPAGARSRSTSPRSGGASATGSSTSSTSRAAWSTRAVGGLGLQPRGQRLHALDAVQEAAALRRRALQVRLDALQAAALRVGGPRVRPPAQLHRRAGEADGRSRAPTSARRRTRTSPARSTTSTSSGPAPTSRTSRAPTSSTPRRSPAEAEAKLRDRDRSRAGSALIPQDKPWTIEIYKALALEFRTINQYKNALDVYQIMLDKWPMDPVGAGRPERDRRDLRPAREADEGRAPSAATTSRRCSRRAPRSRSTSATRRGSTRTRTTRPRFSAPRSSYARASRARPSRTRATGRRPLESADQTGDPKEKLRLTTYALQEYKLAALGWLGYLKQDENAPDAYKSRYFYADALHNQVRLEVALHQFDPKLYPEPYVAGDRDRRAGGRRRPRLGRGRPVHRQRGSLRRRPRRRRPRSRLPALAGLGRDPGRRAAQGPEARGDGGRQEGRRRRIPRRHPDVDEGARRVHPARAARARQAEPRRRLRLLRGRSVLPLRALRARPSRASRRSTRSAAARTRSATRRGSASSS